MFKSSFSSLHVLFCFSFYFLQVFFGGDKKIPCFERATAMHIPNVHLEPEIAQVIKEYKTIVAQTFIEKSFTVSRFSPFPLRPKRWIYIKRKRK